MIARRYWKAIFYLALVIQASATCLAAERYVFDVFDEERGLGNTSVTRLAKDHRGFLWIGTENGLYCYDGHRFLAFTTSEGLPSNKITAIHESPDGTLWVGTLEGLAWRDGAGFRKSRNEGLKGYVGLQGIASDRTGRVFIATRKGIAVTSPPAPGKDLQVAFLLSPAGVPQPRTSNVYVASPEAVWFGCDTAICRWNGTDVRVWDRDAGVPPHKWDFFLMDRSGNLWARNRDSLIELVSGTDRFRTIDPDVPGPISIPPELAMDTKGRILVTTNRGLAIGGPGGWRRVTQKQGLPANFVTAVLQDAEGSMWLGTYGAGLARWAGYDAWRSFSEVEGLASSAIYSLLDDPPSGMWAGTAAGLSHGAFSKGTWNWSEVSIPGVGWASSLTRGRDGALWMLTEGHYVVRYDPLSRTSRRLGPFGEGPFHVRIDSAGRLWIADSGSVALGGAESRLEDFERIRPPGTTPGTLFTVTVEDAHGNLWVGSMSGLFRRSQGKWFRYDRNSRLRATRIVDLALAPEGDVWVTYSEPNGVDRIRVAGDTVDVEHFDRSKGLSSDSVYSTAFDRQGQLWILNDRGVDVRRGDTWAHFGRADGLISNGSNGRAFWAAADGAIWIGSERGLSRYEPSESAEVHPEPLRVRYSEVRIGNTALDPGSGAVVEATPQPFAVKFSALLLAHGPEVRYRYRISGFDDRWQETARPEAQFDYLPPGTYRLEVQARRDAQPWIGPAATLGLEVRPHWYGTRLFRGMLLALVCAALWLLGEFRKKNAEAARRTLKRIVDQRTAELRESEERFRNMADTAPVMIWVSDEKKQLTFFNKTWLNFTGRTMEQELGDGWAAGVHPDDVQNCYETFCSAFDAHRNFQVEHRLRRADGEYRSILCSGVPRFVPGGIFAGYIGCDIDITDLQSEERFRELAENIDQVFWMLDLDTDQVLYISPSFEKVWGCSASSYRDRDSLVQTVNAEDRGRFVLFRENAKAQPIEETYRIVRPDGSMRWIRDRSFPVHGPEGKPYRVAGIAEDVTAHRELEEELRQAQKMDAVGRLAGGVAHDFNNLLTVIGGYSRTLLDGTPAEDPKRFQLEQVLQASNRAAALTSQLLAFSRKQVPQPRLINLNNLVTNVESLLRRVIGEHIVFHAVLADCQPYVQADPNQLEQVLINLAANARDAMPDGGEFRIETALVDAREDGAEGRMKEGNYARLKVSDSGIGMNDAVLEHAFEPFFTTKGVGKGTGLGLSTVYGLVQQNHGTIHVSSERGQGTAFEICFPAVPGGEEVQESGGLSGSQQGNETILVAEDEPGVRKLVCDALELIGYTVLAAADGYEAMRILEQRSEPVHLLLTDVIMPLMGGRELAKRVQSVKPETKVIYMSGYTDDALAFHGFPQPNTGFIQKPFTVSTLVGEIRRVLSEDSQ